MWNESQIEKHKEAAEKLKKVKNELINFMGKNKGVSEYKVNQLALKRFKELKLATEEDSPIIAFGENTSEIHHFEPERSKKLEKDTIVLIDLWAKLNQPDSPYADCTWMAYYGEEIPSNVEKSFNAVTSARDRCLRFIEKEISSKRIPTGEEVSEVSNQYLKGKGYEGQLKHHTGHSLGFTSPHGEKKNISPGSRKPLSINHGYAIEPGIYFPGEYGVRTEINFYISREKHLEVTSEVQSKIIKF